MQACMSPLTPDEVLIKSERYMRGRIAAMKQHSEIEIDELLRELNRMRRDYVSISNSRDWYVKPLYMAFHGFATDFERSVFLRCVKYACTPRVLYSSFKGSGAFEGVMLVNPHSGTASTDDFERLFDLFKMSLGSTDLGSFMSLSMIACIERIDTGQRMYGNWTSLRAQAVRTSYEMLKRDRDVREQHERVRVETGLHFTTGNMLSLHHLRNNAIIDANQYRHLLLQVNAMLNTLCILDGDMSSISIQYQFVRNIQQLISDATASPQPPAGPPGLIIGIIDLTM